MSRGGALDTSPTWLTARGGAILASILVSMNYIARTLARVVCGAS